MVDHSCSYTQRLGLSLMQRYESEIAQWHYVTGLGLECLYRAGKVLGKQDWLEWVKAQYDAFLAEDGTIKEYRIDEYSLDQVSPGKVFFDLYALTGENRYRSYLDLLYSQLESQPRTVSNGFWHKKIYPNQMWLDGLYMQGTFYLRYAVLNDRVEQCLEDLVSQCELIFGKTHDQATGLLFHAWDESRQMAWSDSRTGLSQCFWSRAIGWYCMSLVDIMDFIPKEDRFDSYKKRLQKLAADLVRPLLAVQDPGTGLWWQVLDQGGRGKNYLESSGSAMFVYFLLKMVRKGWLDSSIAADAKAAGLRGFSGLCSHKVYTDAQGQMHVKDICRGAGLGKYYPECPFRDGTFSYYTEREPIVEDNLQGVGPFLLACLEAEFPEKLEGFPSSPYW